MMIADKQEGSFQVVVKSMRPMRHGPKPVSPMRSNRASLPRLSAGYRLQQGDAQGCADIYRDTLEMLMQEGAFGQGPGPPDGSSSISKVAKADEFEAAWTLRWAMDRMMPDSSGGLPIGPSNAKRRWLPSCPADYSLRLHPHSN